MVGGGLDPLPPPVSEREKELLNNIQRRIEGLRKPVGPLECQC
jgi:hypothetical protein